MKKNQFAKSNMGNSLWKLLMITLLFSCPLAQNYPLGLVSILKADEISPDPKLWHKMTVTFDGPNTSEGSNPNPFMDYRLNVAFIGPSSQLYVVPGFYAADGDAANTGATSGNKWQVRFIPDEEGEWIYTASFRTGNEIAIDLKSTAGSSAGYFDAHSDTFLVGPTDKSGRDHRGKGMLRYVREHYRRFDNGDYYLKNGIDSPETFLGYYEFDNTPDGRRGILTYSAHASDYDAADASDFTWDGGKGKNILGAIKYLSDLGINSIYFLTYNLDGGDGLNAFMWTSASERERFDVSKLAQWELAFDYMDKKGIMLHVVQQEQENDEILGGSAGVDGNPVRMLYYRELIARFASHNAVTWNIGEENHGVSDADRKSNMQYVRAQDPYAHINVVHTWTTTSSQQNVYNPLLNQPYFEGPSLQVGSSGGTNTSTQTKYWVDASANAGRKWIVTLDEDNPELSNPDDFRKISIWGNLMGGGAGMEYYDGDDQTLQNFSVNATKYIQGGIAINFFHDYLPFTAMHHNDALTSNSDDYVFASAGQLYAVYLPNGGTTNLNLNGESGTFSVHWFDPRNGGALQDGSVTEVNGGGNPSLGNAPNNTSSDWVVLVSSGSFNYPPETTIISPADGANFHPPADVTVEIIAVDNEDSLDRVELYVNNSLEDTKYSAPFIFELTGLTQGSYQIEARAYDTQGASDSDIIQITLYNEYTITTNAANGYITVNPSQDSYYSGTEVTLKATGDLGYAFSFWSGDLSGTDNPATITMDADKNVTANFTAANIYTLTTTAENGSITLDPAGPQYTDGTVVKLDAKANPGYVFSNWSGDDVDYGSWLSQTTITMNANKSITANFIEVVGAPQVTFVMPVDSARYDPPANIQVTVSATDADGSISNVKLYINDAFIRQENIAPYEWNNTGQDALLQGLDENFYTLRAEATDNLGNIGSKSIMIIVGNPVGFRQAENMLPQQTFLAQNYPNPFNPETTIPYQLSELTHVKVVIYNTLGNQVAVLVDKQQSAGNYTVKWHGKNDFGKQAASGVYLYRLETKDFIQIKKLILIR